MKIMSTKQTQIQELTIENIVGFAQNTKKRFEAFSPKFDRWNDEIGDQFFNKSLVGVELKPNVWFWWEQLGDILFFSHRYNQNNGATIKSFRKGYEAEKEILKSLNSL